MTTQQLFEAQRATFLSERAPTAAVRIDRLTRLEQSVARHATSLAVALQEDYGGRSPVQAIAMEPLTTRTLIRHSRNRVERWMRPTRPRVGAMFRMGGIGAEIHWQPRGVVGVISPWNFPVALTLHPVAQALAAGNRCMAKVSELTPRTAEVLQRAISEHFEPEELAIVTGGPDVAAEFTALPFDHILFTGSTATGKRVMEAAARNLTSVTLELGGKSPVVVAADADIERVAQVMVFAKTLNAGQYCVAPDRLFLPRGTEDRFVDAAAREAAKLFPAGLDSPDYTAIVNDAHHERLLGYLADADALGARVVELLDLPDGRSRRKVPPTLVLDVSPDMVVADEEIFGPLLQVEPYDDVRAVVAAINAGPSPLAAYWFGGPSHDRDHFVRDVRAGGVTLNDVLLHVGVEAMPFGGFGASGMGSYHGRAGFETFSHGKTVVRAPRFALTRLLGPPYPKRSADVLRWVARRESAFGRRGTARDTTPRPNPSDLDHKGTP